MEILSNMVVDFGGNDFLEPYLRREFGLEPVADEHPVDITATCAVRIESDSTDVAPDEKFVEYCKSHNLPVATLKCNTIIGTNMNGLPRRIAAGIDRGTFVQIAGNEARISLVHATDVARAVRVVGGATGEYALHDGENPTMSQLADAIAYRFDNKRLITVKPRWARLWYGTKYFTLLTTDHLSCGNSFLDSFPEFKPINTIQYLYTHDYDEQSL